MFRLPVACELPRRNLYIRVETGIVLFRANYLHIGTSCEPVKIRPHSPGFPSFYSSGSRRIDISVGTYNESLDQFSSQL